jgi:excisionase family DNA binding protein
LKQFTVSKKQLSKIVKMDIKFYSKKELSEILGVCVRSVDNWIASGIISYSKVGRRVFISKDDLDQFIENNHRDAFFYQNQYEEKLNKFLDRRRSSTI